MSKCTYTSEYEQYYSTSQSIHPLSFHMDHSIGIIHSPIPLSHQHSPLITSTPHNSNDSSAASYRMNNQRKAMATYVPQQRMPTLPHSEQYQLSQKRSLASDNQSKRQRGASSGPFRFYDNTILEEEKEDEDTKSEEESRLKHLEKNRLAAFKCRQRRKKWVEELGLKAERMTRENQHLRELLTQLKEETIHLKAQLLMHERKDPSIKLNKRSFTYSIQPPQ